jgi:hypothetical protein
MTDRSLSGFVAAREDAPSPIRVGDVFGRSLKIFSAHGLACCGIVALGDAPLAVAAIGAISYFEFRGLASAVIAIIALAAFFVCLTLAPAAIAFGVAQDIGGRGFSARQSLRMALKRAGAIIGLAILIDLATALALALFIAPGLIVLCVYAVALPACAVEGLGPRGGAARSAFLTRGNRRRVFGILCLLYGGGAAVDLTAWLASERVAGALVALAIALPLDLVIRAFGAVAIGVLYTRLRIAREGVDIAHVAAVFD